MSASKHISQVFETAKQLSFNDSSRLVLMSDCHRGDGNWYDDFAPNQNLYFSALTHYYNNGFTYIELGDGDELWKIRRFSAIADMHSHIFWLLTEFFKAGRLHFIYGNHDIVKRNDRWMKNNYSTRYNEQTDKTVPLFPGAQAHNGIVLLHTRTKDKILLLHGHQADFFNDTLWRLSRFLVRYVMRPLEMIGVNDPTRAAKNYKKRGAVERKLIRWVKDEQQMLIAGHTHRPVFPDVGKPPYFNDGCIVHPRCMTAIEIAGGEILLIKWSVKTKADGTLYVGRDVLAGPEKLSGYFAYGEEKQDAFAT